MSRYRWIELKAVLALKTRTIFERIANEWLVEVPTYVPGPLAKYIAALSGLKQDQIVKLSSNENPLGPPPLAVKSVLDSTSILSYYPDSQARELRAHISTWLGGGFNPNNIVVGSGSSETMSLIVRAFSKEGDHVVCVDPSFLLHREIASIEGRKPIIAKLTPEAFELKPDDVMNVLSNKTKIIFIARPNNPTGRLVPLKVVRQISENCPDAVVVCDEAYVEFADDYPEASAASLVDEYGNILVTRTFSKVFGLCDLRVGYTVGPESAIKFVSKIKPKWNVGMLAQNACSAALRDIKHFEKTLATVKGGREYLKKELLKLGFGVVPNPQGNFLMVKVSVKGFTSAQFFHELATKGFSIRGGTEDLGNEYIRISVGTQAQNRTLIEAIQEVAR